MSQLKNINNAIEQSLELGFYVDNKASDPVKIKSMLKTIERYPA
jgi:hypothetical protein